MYLVIWLKCAFYCDLCVLTVMEGLAEVRVSFVCVDRYGRVGWSACVFCVCWQVWKDSECQDPALVGQGVWDNHHRHRGVHGHPLSVQGPQLQEHYRQQCPAYGILGRPVLDSAHTGRLGPKRQQCPRRFRLWFCSASVHCEPRRWQQREQRTPWLMDYGVSPVSQVNTLPSLSSLTSFLASFVVSASSTVYCISLSVSVAKVSQSASSGWGFSLFFFPRSS